MEYVITFTWDDEADVWIAASNDIPGFVLESGSFDALLERSRFAIPELLELNTPVTKQEIIFTGGSIMTLPQGQIYTTNDIYALPEGQRAELIDGQMYMMAPPTRIHQQLITELVSAIHQHIKNHNGSCQVYPAPFAVFLNEDDKNYVEPDISIICDRNNLTDKGCNGAPDWVIEIVSPSTERIDYGIKLFKYRSSGVREYWIINPITKTVNVFDFEHDEKTRQYSFEQDIPSCIYEDFAIRVSGFLE